MKTYIFSVIRSASFYPLGTFWLISMGIIPSIVAKWIELGMGLLILTATAGILILIADYRDTQILRNDVRVIRSQLVTLEESVIITPIDPNTKEDDDG